jgi:hypothetical protein
MAMEQHIVRCERDHELDYWFHHANDGEEAIVLMLESLATLTTSATTTMLELLTVAGF